MIRTLSFIILWISLFSCEDFFSTTVDIDIPEHEPKLVVHAFGNTLLDSITVLVTQSVKINENPFQQKNLIQGARITIKSSEGQEAQFTEIVPDANYVDYNYILRAPNFLKEGVQYELQVEKDGFETVTATQTVPFSTRISKAIFIKEGGLDNDGNKRSAVDLSFKDPEEINNYYEATLLRTSNNNVPRYFEILDLTSTDPATSASFDYYSLVISDISFNGDQKTLRLLTWPEHEDNQQIKKLLFWSSITEDHYRFSKLAKKARENNDNPFGSPVLIPSNMSNGIGIFALAAGQLIPVD